MIFRATFRLPVVILTACLLVFPQESGDILLKNGARLSNSRFEEQGKDGFYTISADLPQITGTSSSNAEKFNEAARAIVFQEVESFRSLMLGFSSEDLKSSSDRGISNYSEIGYNITLANEDLVSVLFANSTYTGGVHPNSRSFVLNFDLKNGKIISLKDLFIKDSGYLRVLSDLAISDLEQQMNSPGDEWIARGAGENEENFRSWNLTENGLQLIFDQYQVAPYVAGPQEVTIPFSQLRSILKVSDTFPLRYANGGNPVNWCRNGLFPRDGEDFRIARIKGKRNQKIFFHNDDEKDCPKSAKCRSNSYIIPNDHVIVSRTYDGFACGWYQPKNGFETVGWIPLSSLDFIKNAKSETWAGTWSFAENSIEIAAVEPSGNFKITGNAFWKGLGDNIHIGEIDFSGVPLKNKMELGDAGEYECRVKMQIAGKFLIVSDNLNCGGANVTFSGVYQKTSK